MYFPHDFPPSLYRDRPDQPKSLRLGFLFLLNGNIF